MNEELLFSLLRLGLGTNNDVQKENISDLLVATKQSWVQLKEVSDFQGVSAIVLDGIQVVMNELGAGCFNRSLSQNFWKVFILQWIGEVHKCYESGNLLQLTVVDNIQRLWAKAGIRMMLMKGLAMGLFYPDSRHRAPGDIDCYLFNDYSKGNEEAKAWADIVNEDWYKHSVISYQGQTIENHQFFVHTREGKISKQLNQTLCETLKDSQFDTLAGTGVLVPPPMFNATFLTYHALSHFLEEGLKLKQLVDWAMFLKRDADKVDWQEFYSICEKYHLRRFADVATDFAVHYLGVKLNNPQICAESPYTAKVIHSTLNDKDYVFSSGEGEWANRWHIVRNLFKYRWKYKKIYQHSIIKQLWWYTSGYLLKKE